MAFHAFKQPRLSSDLRTLFLDGNRKAGFDVATLHAVIIARKDEDKRLEGTITGSPVPDDWSVPIDQSQATKPFADDEEVYLVGVATSKDGETFVWGGVSTAEGKIEIGTVEVKKSEPIDFAP